MHPAVLKRGIIYQADQKTRLTYYCWGNCKNCSRKRNWVALSHQEFLRIQALRETQDQKGSNINFLSLTVMKYFFEKFNHLALPNQNFRELMFSKYHKVSWKHFHLPWKHRKFHARGSSDHIIIPSIHSYIWAYREHIGHGALQTTWKCLPQLNEHCNLLY